MPEKNTPRAQLVDEGLEVGTGGRGEASPSLVEVPVAGGRVWWVSPLNACPEQGGPEAGRPPPVGVKSRRLEDLSL